MGVSHFSDSPLWLLLACVGRHEQEIENEGCDEIPGCVLHLASSAATQCGESERAGRQITRA
jgi:hypothetical protein